MNFLNLSEIVSYYLLALGITYVITGSEIGYWLRALWCLLLSWSRPTRYWWAIVRCPSCNNWWTGLVVGFVVSHAWLPALQLAFISCGLTGVLQHVLGGDGIAANEDFDEIFKGVN